MRRFGRLIGFVLCLALGACDNFQSSVPRLPVRMIVDTNAGIYVHFVPTALCQYVILDRNGYHYIDYYEARKEGIDQYGYGGVIIYINILGNYDAYDLACSYCAEHGGCVPCEIDGIFAVCPHCGEQYDLGSGTAAPQKGISKQSLLRLALSNNGGVLKVEQRQ